VTADEPTGERDDGDAGRDVELSAGERLARIRATAIRLDSSPAIVRAVEGLRRRLPGDARFGDAISTEERKPVNLLARGVSALEPDRPSAAHELGLGALQVWQALSRAAGRGAGDRDVAMLFTDLVDFSKWALDVGDAAAVELLREVGAVLDEAVTEHAGAVVKRLGDGLMAAFDTPADAVEAALDGLDGVAAVEVAGHRPRMRCGVHWGRPRRLGGDYLGVDVNVAARVVSAAKGGQLLVSTPACEQLEADRYELGRPRRLREKGTPSELRVQTVSRSD
jgi:adenylate cyclase